MVEREELKSLLRQLKSSENAPETEEKARQFLENVDPQVLSLAEQELIQEGFSPDELRRLCEVHLQVLSLKREKSQLPTTHPITILKGEHEVILENLDTLEKATKKVDATISFEEAKEDLKKIEEAARLLVEAEKHHQREEDALFPRLEQAGITGPPRIMRMEHEDLRARKRELRSLLEQRHSLDFNDFVEKLDALEGYIVPTLRDHIFKEDNILYPTALKSLGQEQWKKMKQEFDEIGYCFFTLLPAQEQNKTETLDLRTIPPFERHTKIFEQWDKLAKGQTLRITNDHDPKPLHYQFMIEQEGRFEWEYEQNGPVEWIVRIKKTQQD